MLKAITPVIGVIILVLIVVALAGSTYTFYIGVYESTTSKSIRIFPGADQNSVIVQNLGTQNIEEGDIKIYVEGVEATVLTHPTIKPQESMVIDFIPTGSGKNAKIRVVGPANVQSFVADIVSVLCSGNSECGADGFTGGPYCVGNNVTQNFTTYTCNDPGMPTAFCSNQTAPVLNQTCSGGYVCSGGVCETGLSQNVCIFDYTPITDCSGFTNDLCTDGYAAGSVTDYTSSIDLGPGVTGIQSLRFELYFTECAPSQLDLLVNGISVGSSSTRNQCSCTPTLYPEIVTITNQTLLNNIWNFSGSNTIVIDTPGGYYPAGHEFTINYTSCSPFC